MWCGEEQPPFAVTEFDCYLDAAHERVGDGVIDGVGQHLSSITETAPMSTDWQARMKIDCADGWVYKDSREPNGHLESE